MTIDLTAITLDIGAHTTRDDGVCLLEAIAWFVGEPHSDSPKCVSPVLAAYGRSLNDVLPDDRRQELTPFIPAMAGTAGDGHGEARGYLALDWLIRTYTPAWLDLAGLTVEAQTLRDLRRIVDVVSAEAAVPVVREARGKSAAAWDAAWDVAWDVVGAAAWDAAWDAARAATRDAAWDAARAAAWATAGDAAWDAARDAAGDAARAATRAAAWATAGDATRAAAWATAGDAAWDAARDAAWDAARAAARAATRAAVAPTVTTLQTSAIQLLNNLINPTT